jgi:type IV secretion system protein VirB5
MSNNTDYQAARREWLERYGDYIAQAKNWRLIAVGSLAIAALFGAGMVYEAQRVKVVPYVIAMDKLGDSVRLAQAIQAGAVDKPVVTHIVANFVTRVRERISDPNAENEAFRGAYNYVTADAQQALNNYFGEHSPLEAIGNPNLRSRTVEIVSCLPMGPQAPDGRGSYQVQWIERDINAQGQQIKETHWTGIIQYLVDKSLAKNAQDVLSNPFGVYITGFQWQETHQ